MAFRCGGTVCWITGCTFLMLYLLSFLRLRVANVEYHVVHIQTYKHTNTTIISSVHAPSSCVHNAYGITSLARLFPPTLLSMVLTSGSPPTATASRLDRLHQRRQHRQHLETHTVSTTTQSTTAMSTIHPASKHARALLREVFPKSRWCASHPSCTCRARC